MIDVSAGTFRRFVDHGVLISKLETALTLEYPPSKINVPYAPLTALGADLLNAASGDFGAMWVRWDSRSTAKLASITAATAMNGAIPINAMLLAAILGRGDLQDRFKERGRFSLEAGLQWLVLHGVCEHRLWHFVDRPLRQALLRPVVDAHLTRMPGLGALILRERPELTRRFVKHGQWQAEAFQLWLREEGLDTYRLFWLVPANDLEGWAMRDWKTRELLHPPSLSNLSVNDAANLQRFAAEAIRTHLHLIDDWRAAQRPDVVEELRSFSIAAQLLINSPGIPSKDGWLALAEGRFTIISPMRQRSSSFVMVEIQIEDSAIELIVAASWRDTALPVTLHRSGRNCCVMMRLPTVQHQDALGLLHVALLQNGDSVVPIELIRIWNI